jgi:hypothetical protein
MADIVLPKKSFSLPESILDKSKALLWVLPKKSFSLPESILDKSKASLDYVCIVASINSIMKQNYLTICRMKS